MKRRIIEDSEDEEAHEVPIKKVGVQEPAEDSSQTGFTVMKPSEVQSESDDELPTLEEAMKQAPPRRIEEEPQDPEPRSNAQPQPTLSEGTVKKRPKKLTKTEKLELAKETQRLARSKFVSPLVLFMPFRYRRSA